LKCNSFTFSPVEKPSIDSHRASTSLTLREKYTLKDSIFSWDGNKFFPFSILRNHSEKQPNSSRSSVNTNDFGYGLFDGIRLAWFDSDGEMIYPFNFICDDHRTYRNVKVQDLSMEINGNSLISHSTSSNRSFKWIIKGDIPEALIVMLQIVHHMYFDLSSKPEIQSIMNTALPFIKSIDE